MSLIFPDQCYEQLFPVDIAETFVWSDDERISTGNGQCDVIEAEELLRLQLSTGKLQTVLHGLHQQENELKNRYDVINEKLYQQLLEKRTYRV